MKVSVLINIDEDEEGVFICRSPHVPRCLGRGPTAKAALETFRFKAGRVLAQRLAAGEGVLPELTEIEIEIPEDAPDSRADSDDIPQMPDEADVADDVPPPRKRTRKRRKAG